MSGKEGMPRPAAAWRRAMRPSTWASLLFAAARLTCRPSASPVQPSRRAFADVRGQVVADFFQPRALSGVDAEEGAPDDTRAWQVTDVERGEDILPVDGGHVRVAVNAAGPLADEAVPEVAAGEEGSVADEQLDSGFDCQQAAGPGAERVPGVSRAHRASLREGLPGRR